MPQVKQQVYLSKTQSGRPGLFTNRMLSWHLSWEQFHAFAADRNALKAYVERLGFELADTTEAEEKIAPNGASVIA